MKIKRILLLVLSLTLLLTAAQPGFVRAAAADTPQVLLDLMKKFPHKAYWNHVGSEKNNPDGVTASPCPNHIGCSWVEGACSCNSFCQAIQCMGFAYKAAYDIVGTNPREWEMRTTLDADKLRVGDVIRYRGNRHSLCVTGVKGNRISFVDSNWYPLCQIRWGSMDLDDMPSFSYVLHDPHNKLKNKNLDFHQSMVDSTPETAPVQTARGEIWATTAVMNLRRRTGTDSPVETQLPAGINFAVTDKKVNNGYLWGKTTYGGKDGWVALDHCTYLYGATDAPQFLWPSDVRPVNTSFTLYWSAVDGADYYKIFIYDKNDTIIEKGKTTATSKAFTLSKVGTYYVSVESFSDHAPSWSLTGDALEFLVQKPEDIRITSLLTDAAEKTLTVGGKDALRVTVRPYCAYKGTITYTSSDPKIVETDANGNLRGVSCGKATVTAKDTRTGVHVSCTVSVVPDRAQNLRQSTKALAENSVTLVWTKVPQATGYYVYRRKTDGHFQYIARVTTNKFTDTGLGDSREYTYLVKAFCETKSGTVTGEGSPAATAVTRPAAVKKLTVTPGKGRLTLKWTNNAHADGYLIYCADSKGKYRKVAEATSNQLTLFVESGKTFSYKIRAVKEFGGKNILSALSEAASGKAT